jgi:uncharacterized protein
VSDDSAGDDRDRRADGRPEQARPRDRTGRPLAYGTTDVPLAEDHQPATVEEALALGISLWDQQRYFEAHECLEHVWHAAPLDDTDLWQGVIQIAVGGVHVQRGNPTGAVTMFERAADRLRPYPALHRGIDVTAAVTACERAAAQVRAGTEVELPPFPAGPDGAWFTADPARLGPSSTSTPLPDEPAWLAAGRRRQPRRRGE